MATDRLLFCHKEKWRRRPNICEKVTPGSPPQVRLEEDFKQNYPRVPQSRPNKPKTPVTGRGRINPKNVTPELHPVAERRSVENVARALGHPRHLFGTRVKHVNAQHRNGPIPSHRPSQNTRIVPFFCIFSALSHGSIQLFHACDVIFATFSRN